MPITPSHFAGRGMRLVARIIDGLIHSVPFFFVLPGIFSLVARTELLQTSGMTEEEIMQQMAVILAESGLLMNIMMAVAGWLIITVIQLVLLTKNGQTIGKKVVGVKIVMTDTGKNGGFVPNVLLRTFVNGLLSAIPLYSLIDALFIFREDRRCVHDMIANTSVIKA